MKTSIDVDGPHLESDPRMQPHLAGLRAWPRRAVPLVHDGKPDETKQSRDVSEFSALHFVLEKLGVVRLQNEITRLEDESIEVDENKEPAP